MSQPSVENLQRKLVALASRPVVEFNKHDALELLDSLRETARDAKHGKSQYYRAAYLALRDKMGESTAYFRELLLALVGDKDQEKVLERVSRVDKRLSRNVQEESRFPVKRFRGPFPSSSPMARQICYYCRLPGHFQAQCFKRRRDQSQNRRSDADGASSSAPSTSLNT